MLTRSGHLIVIMVSMCTLSIETVSLFTVCVCVFLTIEAVHFARMLVNHGFFFSVEGSVPVRDDGTLFRFQVSREGRLDVRCVVTPPPCMALGWLCYHSFLSRQIVKITV